MFLISARVGGRYLRRIFFFNVCFWFCCLCGGSSFRFAKFNFVKVNGPTKFVKEVECIGFNKFDKFVKVGKLMK